MSQLSRSPQSTMSTLAGIQQGCNVSWSVAAVGLVRPDRLNAAHESEGSIFALLSSNNWFFLSSNSFASVEFSHKS